MQATLEAQESSMGVDASSASNDFSDEKAENILVANNVYKSFDHGDVLVLRGLSLEVKLGERIAIIGANGSGKSTFLRCCMHLLETDSGRISIDGKELRKLPGRKRRKARGRIGMVFQKHNLQPRLSALTNVLHGAIARGYGPRVWRQAWAPRAERERALHCLDMVGLADLASRPARKLSGGQSQRVAIARCLMQNPDILLADEPAASLDPSAGEEVMAMFSDLAKQQGLTLIYVSHDMDHAVNYADRVISLRDGVITKDSPADAIRAEELREFFV
jgi:phosphonate transport system ATP-binding protein